MSCFTKKMDALLADSLPARCFLSIGSCRSIVLDRPLPRSVAGGQTRREGPSWEDSPHAVAWRAWCIKMLY